MTAVTCLLVLTCQQVARPEQDFDWARQRTDRVIRLMLEGDALRAERERLVSAKKSFFASLELDRLTGLFQKSSALFTPSSTELRSVRLELRPMPEGPQASEAALKARVTRFALALGYEGLTDSSWLLRPIKSDREGYLRINVSPRRYGLRAQDQLLLEVHPSTLAIRSASFPDPLTGPKGWRTLISPTQAGEIGRRFVASRGGDVTGHALRVLGPRADSFRPRSKLVLGRSGLPSGFEHETMASARTQAAMRTGTVFAHYMVQFGEFGRSDTWQVGVDGGSGEVLYYSRTPADTPGTIEP